ncbi:MAG TPA: EAL domain-containing protein [Gammaproteobacteria bacterium]|nr:EAL domain-containing protein [Gammaproteobacteria bacterium]
MPSDQIAIVAVDEKSLQALGRWPWSRRLHAELLDRLTRYEARVVGFDIAFAEDSPAPDTAADAVLAGSIATNRRVVLPVFPEQFDARHGSLAEVLPLPALANAAAKLGHVDVELDADAIARSVYLKAGLGSPVWPTLALAMDEVAQGRAWAALPGEDRVGAVPGPDGTWVRDRRVLIDFAGPPGSFRHLSFIDVLSQDAVAASLRGKYVLVGATAAGLGEALSTPMSGEQRPMSGVELHANVLDNLLAERWIEPLAWPPRLALLLALASIPALLFPRLTPRAALAACAALIVAVFAGTVLALRVGHLWIAPAPALLALLASYPLWSWRRIEDVARNLLIEKEYSRATLQAVGEAIVSTDRHGRVSYMNPMAERMSGYPQREAQAMDIDEVFWSPRRAEREKLLQAIAQAVAENRPVRSLMHATLQTRLGDQYVVRITASPISDDRGRAHGVVLALTDVTETVELTNQMHHQATHDALTQLPNRALLSDRLAQAIGAARRSGDIVAVMFFDLDNFKYVNESLGHSFGDAVLLDVSSRLATQSRDADTVGRWDGDQFALICAGLRGAESAAAIARKLLDELRRPYHIADQEIHVSASVGISLFPRDGDEPPVLFQHADTALHRVKQRDADGIAFFDEEFNQHARARQALEQELRLALKRNEFELHYQPQVVVATGAIVGAEALLRWRHPERGLLPPKDFIGIAESSDLIAQIGAQVMQTACVQAREWQQRGLAIRVGVNVSVRQFAQRSLLPLVQECLQETGLDPALLMLEITESLVMRDVQGVAGLVQELKALGVRVAIDDFGTGYSSLSNLRLLALDQVKIDRSFVQDLSVGPDDAAIVRAVIAMAHSMRLEVVAKGVETPAQLEFLRAHRCDQIQGFLVSEARPAAQLTELLERRRLDAASRWSELGGPGGEAPRVH